MAAEEPASAERGDTKAFTGDRAQSGSDEDLVWSLPLFEEREARRRSRRKGRIMARAGDELVNRVTGLRTIFRKTAQETDGELLQVNWIGDSGWSAGPKHVHPYQEERFTVLSGTLGSHVDGVERAHGEGEVIVVPAGSIHTVWNAGGDVEVHALVEFRPALRSEVVLETFAGLARDGKTNKAGVPRNPLRLALIVREYEDEIYLARPPLFVQRAIFGVLASIGRLIGYRAEYPYPYARQSDPSPIGRRTRYGGGAVSGPAPTP